MAGNSHEIDGDTRKDTIITKTGDNMIPDALTGYQPKLNDAYHQVPGALAGYSQNRIQYTVAVQRGRGKPDTSGKNRLIILEQIKHL